jgi:hypothetical protein
MCSHVLREHPLAIPSTMMAAVPVLYSATPRNLLPLRLVVLTVSVISYLVLKNPKQEVAYISARLILIATNLANDCTAALGATPFCADGSWALWAPSSGYFCCLQGETGLLSGSCASNDEVIASSLTASYVSSFSLATMPLSRPPTVYHF